MIDRPVVVLGLQRSGCSLVAGVCHRLGWHAGVKLYAPHPPSWRLDWQEIELSDELVARRTPTRQWWQNYLLRRTEASKALGFGGRYVLNCQWLALKWDAMLHAMGDTKPVVIRCYRDEAGVRASMAAHPALRQADQEEIGVALYRNVVPDIEVSYDWAVDDPGRFVETLAVVLQVEDDAAVQAAIQLVGRPTEYPCPTTLQLSGTPVG